MQLLKSMSVLSLTAVVSAAVWTIWNLPNSSRADQGLASETLQSQLEEVLNRKPEPELFGIHSSDYELGFAAFFESEEKLEIYLTDKNGPQTVIHEIQYELVQTPLPNSDQLETETETQEGAKEKTLKTEPAQTLRGSYRLHSPNQTPNELKFSWMYSRTSAQPALTFLGGSSVPIIAGTMHTDGPTQSLQTIAAEPAAAAKSDGRKEASAFPWPLTTPAESNASKVIFNPFAGTLVASKDASLKINNRLPVEFKRLAKEDATKYVVELSAKANALDLLTPVEIRTSDASQLVVASQKCIDSTAQFGERMLRSLPNVPYLLHRKANLLQSLCKGTRAFGEELQDQDKPVDLDKSLNNIMATRVRNVFKSQSQELPRSIVSSPNWTIIFDDQKQHLWINALREIVEQSIAEINDTILFEDGRKVPVKMQVILRGRTMGTVVKGLIKNKKLEIASHVVVAPEGKILNDSWTEVPKNNLATAAAGRTPMLNGQALLYEPSLWNALGDICRASNGLVAVDLGDTPQSALDGDTTKQFSGVWDDAARLETLDLFLRRGMAAKECNDFTARVTASLGAKAKDLVASFESEVIQAKQEIQLTNSRFRYLNLVPGTYEIYVNSLISGKMLERFDFTVAKDKRNQTISLTVGKEGDVLPETPAETD